MFIIEFLIEFINVAWGVLLVLYFVKATYKYTGIFFTRKFKKAKKDHKYAVLVAARNESAVIGNLVDSIRKQDYPSELVDIFVVADNCTDDTSEVARGYGAVCYERFDPLHRTKGYALQYLVECIRKDYGIDHYEGYFIFDADNLLKSDYIKNMNDSFDAGEKIVTSYRNTKNFDDNWISASYGIHWLRTVRQEHRARSLYRLATRIQGTGFLFAAEVIKDGWNYTSLTEDRAFSADAVANGYKISYNDKAEFYDEQPVDMKTVMRQRIRWAKGHIQALVETGPQLFSHIFVTKGMANKNADHERIKDIPLWKRVFNNIRLRFMSFDMLTIVFPRALANFTKFSLVKILEYTLLLFGSKSVADSVTPKALNETLKLFGRSPEVSSFEGQLIWLIIFGLATLLIAYIKSVLTALYVYIIESKRIKKIKWHRKIWFCLTFPIFDVIGLLSLVIALFKRVEWDPIVHNKALKIEDIESLNAVDEKDTKTEKIEV